MLDIPGGNVTRSGRRVSRRDFVRVGAMGTMGLSVADMFRLKANGAVNQPKAKAVIQIWLNGGPTHTDMFDPKPDSGDDYTGPLKNPIATNVPGIRIGELLPLTARQADKYSIIRSFTHGNNGHEIASYVVQTGTLPSDLVYPAMGAVLAYKRNRAGYKGSLPPYISLTSPLGRFSESGFLGTAYKVFATGGDPNAKTFSVQGIGNPSGVSSERSQERRSLLKTVDSLAKSMDKDKKFQDMGSYQERAYGLILGEAKKAFDMSQEKDELRDKYGRNRNGQSCLLARRLVERGVPFVTINWGGWDTHRDHFGRMKVMLPPLDSAFATLLEDLAARGLLDSTIVVMYGEFGRTPKVSWQAPWDGGRHHFGAVYSAVVAGGGFKGGTVVGSSDQKGERVKDRPVYPWDLSASMYTLLGIDPTSELPHPQGCVAHVTPPAGGDIQSGGMLTEIM